MNAWHRSSARANVTDKIAKTATYSSAIQRQAFLTAYCLKSNVTALRSRKVPWQIQPRHSRCLRHRRQKHSLQRIGEPALGILPSSVLRLIDTHSGSHNCHYVNRFVRGFLPPARWRFSPTCFGPSRLRMRRIIRPRVVAPAIQSAPVATHSVATIAHRAFSLAETILIPDCAPPQRLSPALFPQPPPAPIHSSGRSRP